MTEYSGQSLCTKVRVRERCASSRIRFSPKSRPVEGKLPKPRWRFYLFFCQPELSGEHKARDDEEQEQPNGVEQEEPYEQRGEGV